MKKVLVVENSPTIISVADSLLRTKGYDVTCLTDGEKALEFAQAEKPDLILTAIGLDGMDGLQLCNKINGNTQTGGIPVVLLIVLFLSLIYQVFYRLLYKRICIYLLHDLCSLWQ